MRSETNKILGNTIGAVLWEGWSELDGAPLVVIATGIKKKQLNTKLGNVIQTWILRSDIKPNDAVRTGKDESICGDCKLRAPNRACYVNVGMADRIYEAYHRGRYRMHMFDHEWKALLSGRRVRLGAYGDPCAVPHYVWSIVFDNADNWIGYTHLWKKADPVYKNHLMASVDTPEERQQAKEMGWRTFRTRFANEPLHKSKPYQPRRGKTPPVLYQQKEIACPASKEGGMSTTCEKCMLCNGEQRRLDKRADISIIVHGWSAAVNAYGNTRKGLEIVV